MGMLETWILDTVYTCCLIALQVHVTQTLVTNISINALTVRFSKLATDIKSILNKQIYCQAI